MNTNYFNRFHAVVESGQTRLLTNNSVTSQFETTLKPAVCFDMLQSAGLKFIITDLPSVLILIVADQIINDSLCGSNEYN